MKRFHKSFIGLMEQDKDGEWVRFSEAEALIKEQTATILEELDKKHCALNRCFDYRIHMVPRLTLLCIFGIFYLAQIFYTIFLT